MQKLPVPLIFITLAFIMPGSLVWPQGASALEVTVRGIEARATASVMTQETAQAMATVMTRETAQATAIVMTQESVQAATEAATTVQAPPQATPAVMTISSAKTSAAVMATDPADPTMLPLASDSGQLKTGTAAASTSAKQRQDSVDIENIVREFLLDFASRYKGQARIDIETPHLGNHASCDDMQPQLSGKQALRARMTVTVRCVVPAPWVVHVQASMSIEGGFYVASRTIQAGSTVNQNDLVMRVGDLLRVPGDAVLSPESAIGFIASQRIPAGTTIKSRMLRSPGSVERGQMVRTEVRGPGFVANGEGKALESGAPGTRIQVKANSGQIITGIVLDAHTVRVLM
ncbi:flagellar basal body P-ring formation chaperone FlgA [Pusillimonas sp. ANT_WB101]|uniref:flagellar basal body P-ring formation chaperone FlgA n=1 Tax=Pusillimonas sp. ANT_WB101 TaxID=2597356 RepID=UPI0011EF9656|nr:flagellar basal body P-ring formation chaperone FlgA [Pusillimonas sp. ANT_WB101]KAA0910750.1 flagellar basal body P-ring formation protein FlgA [Pusillimonas sp. ANT_WB101]